MTELIDTTEMYLRIIFELEEEGTPTLRARIVDRLGHSGPTVSQTVARMERDGLLAVQPDRSLLLSEVGRARATRVMRKHRLVERLLFDVIGLEYEHVHIEACRWEHVVSERVERKILRLLEDGRESPYGNPIPGLDELGVLPVSGAGSAVRGVVALADVSDVTAHVEIHHLSEALQDNPEALGRLRGVGLVPGASAHVERRGDEWVLRRAGDEPATLSAELAAHLRVVVIEAVGP
ncbi:MAG: metal-dependent transcriptional regulator [Dermatophilaceae bacterium]